MDQSGRKSDPVADGGIVGPARRARAEPRRDLRAQLAAALGELPAEGLPAVTEAVQSLCADPELAWRSFALSLLADELADE